jgi:hypothetical protein
LAEIRCVEKRETTKKRRKILQKNKFKKDEREKFERGRERGRGKERGINHKSIRVEVTHSTTLLLARASLSLSLSLSVFGFAGARSTKRDDEGALSQKKKEEYYRRCCDEKSVVVLVFVEDDFDEICGRGGLCPRRGQWGIGERRARVVWWSEHRERGADDHDHEESRLAGGFGRHEQ